MIDNLPPNHMIGPEWGQLELPAPTRALGFAAVWLCDFAKALASLGLDAHTDEMRMMSVWFCR